MSAIRRMKKGIPKDTNSCKGCKNLSVIKLFGREEDTNSWYYSGEKYRCSLLKKESCEESPLDFIMSINPNFYNENDLDEIIKEIDIAYDFQRGVKICGLYLEKKSNLNKEKSIDKFNQIIDEDDLPF